MTASNATDATLVEAVSRDAQRRAGVGHAGSGQIAPAPRPRGRPRVFPPGTTATDRKQLLRRTQERAGGHRLDVDLAPSAWLALKELAQKGKRGPFIERLILAELRRRHSAGDAGEVELDAAPTP